MMDSDILRVNIWDKGKTIKSTVECCIYMEIQIELLGSEKEKFN